jgi:hypothetical protein
VVVHACSAFSTASCTTGTCCWLPLLLLLEVEWFEAGTNDLTWGPGSVAGKPACSSHPCAVAPAAGEAVAVPEVLLVLARPFVPLGCSSGSHRSSLKS